MSGEAGGGVSTIETTAKITSRRNSGTSFINYHYFKSFPGVLKFIELLFGIICIATATPPPLPGTYFFLIVCYAAITLTTLWIIIIFFRIESKVPINPSWPVLELFYTGGAFFFYALATAVQFAIFEYVYSGHIKSRSIAAAVFGLFNTVAYAISVYFTFKEWRAAVYFPRSNRIQSPT